MLGLERRGDGGIEGDVEGEIVFAARFEDDAELLQPFEHFDAQRPDGGVGAVGAQSLRHSSNDVVVTAAQYREGVHDAEVGVLAESDDEEHVGGFGGVAVEVVAVVEVSIRGGYVTDRFGDLVNGIVVHR